MIKKDGRVAGFIPNGMVMPIMFFENHDLAQNHETDYSDDNINLVRGIVTDIRPGRIPTLYDHETHFIRCYIKTEFGEMEILHTEEMIPEELRKNMKPGAIVYGAFQLYGNPAFAEYENGVVANEENNLRKLREVLVTGTADEMLEILAEDAEIAFDGEENPGVKGWSEVIQYLKDAYELIDTISSADLATVDRVDLDGHQTMLPGKRCIAFAEVAGEEYTSVWFIENNDDGLITRIIYGRGTGYGLKIDPKPRFRHEEIEEEMSSYGLQ